MHPKNLSYILCVLSLAYIIINSLTYEDQFNASVKLSIWMQSFDNAFVNNLMWFFSFLGFPLLVILLIVYIFVEPNKLLAYKIAFFCVNVGFLNGFLKLAYSGPRPWYAHADVKCMECSAVDFGRPSGHSMFSLFAGLMFYRNYIYNKKNRNQSGDHEQGIFFRRTSQEGSDNREVIFGSEDLTKKILFIILSICLLLIGTSRVYVGAHSFEQVLLGWSYSLICFHLTVYYFEKPIEALFDYRGGNRWVNFKLHLIILFIGFMICLLLPIALFWMKQKTLNMDPWLEQISKKCNITDKNKVLLVVSFYTASFDALTFGVIFGLMFAYRNVVPAQSNYIDQRRNALKILVSMSLFIFFGFLTYILPVGNNPYAIYLIKICSFLFLIPFVFVALLPKLFKKLKLEKEMEEAQGGPMVIHQQVSGDSEEEEAGL